MVPGGQFASVDEYLAAFTGNVREMLDTLRRTIKEAAPAAEEKISYQIPTFWLRGNLVHFAAFTRHVGFYPGPSAIVAFQDELAPYDTSKGAVKFPLDRPVPVELVRRMVQFRAGENLTSPAKRRR